MDDLNSELQGESSEPCTKPLSVPAPESMVTRYHDVGKLVKRAYGKNRVPAIARKRLKRMLDEIENEAVSKLGELGLTKEQVLAEP